MKFSNKSAALFIPCETEPRKALARTTDLCIGAHQDDLELMAYGPIASCYPRADRHFSAVVVTDGGGSPRLGRYAHCTDEEMKAIRVREQKNAARIGRYAALVFLSYPSGSVKIPANRPLIEELKAIILAAAPDSLYTHNLADKHDTHVAVVLQVIRALREIPPDKRPKKLLSMEVWRGLDWLRDEDKLLCDTGAYPHLAAALLGVFDSQISGGKRYDLAAQGRRRANATFFESHRTDQLESAAFGLDISELMEGDMDPAVFIGRYIDRFKEDVIRRIARFS